MTATGSGLLLGSLIPCALFYFLQIYLKRRRSGDPSSSPPPPPAPNAPEVPRSLSRSNLSSRGFTGPVRVSGLAKFLSDSKNSLYDIGLERASRDPYDRLNNPEGIIQLGLSENKLCLDLIGKWLSENLKKSLMGTDDVTLSVNGIATYQPFDGLEELKVAISNLMSHVMGGMVKFDPSNMVLTSGATPAIEMLSFCLADPGDSFLVHTPFYPGFDRDVKWRTKVDLIPVHCRSTDNFTPSITALEQAFSKAKKSRGQVRGILISNPANLGNLLTRDMLKSLLHFAQEKNIHIIADEIFAGSVYERDKFVSIAEILDSEGLDKSRVHIIYGLSKDLSLPGFRVGVIYSFNKTVLTAARMLSRFSSISAPTQRLVISMLSDQRFIQDYFEANRKRLQEIHDKLETHLSLLGIKCAKSCAGIHCWADMRGLIQPQTEKKEHELWEKFMSVDQFQSWDVLPLHQSFNHIATGCKHTASKSFLCCDILHDPFKQTGKLLLRLIIISSPSVGGLLIMTLSIQQSIQQLFEGSQNWVASKERGFPGRKLQLDLTFLFRSCLCCFLSLKLERKMSQDGHCFVQSMDSSAVVPEYLDPEEEEDDDAFASRFGAMDSTELYEKPGMGFPGFSSHAKGTEAIYLIGVKGI
ncbi:putative aminotransferase ACS12 [Senna tora]|uniref:1-aminocyclopropane-1-carboxylate synthase n=1 Tax=Senna tora TaxID=362788 RepID=A0A834T139_9FABA|nr:putative aminotransferase ACS12 [Senna tora]